MPTVTLSETAVAVLRFEVKGWKSRRPGSRLAAYRELAEAGIMEPVPNSEAEYRFTEWGYARREAILREEEDRIERGGSSRPTRATCRMRPGRCCGGSSREGGWRSRRRTAPFSASWRRRGSSI